MSHFKLDIELGNDAMQHGQDIANALKEVGESLDHVMEHGLRGRSGTIRDINGLSVGKWYVTKR